jgi:acyl-coenzyme A synthetase/AMP-(fatty) acid ligase
VRIARPTLLLLLPVVVCLCADLQVMVPSVLESLLPALAPGGTWALSQLQVLVVSGEPLTWQLARRLRQLLPPSCCLVNLYGELGAVMHRSLQ